MIQGSSGGGSASAWGRHEGLEFLPRESVDRDLAPDAATWRDCCWPSSGQWPQPCAPSQRPLVRLWGLAAAHFILRRAGKLRGGAELGISAMAAAGASRAATGHPEWRLSLERPRYSEARLAHNCSHAELCYLQASTGARSSAPEVFAAGGGYPPRRRLRAPFPGRRRR